MPSLLGNLQCISIYLLKGHTEGSILLMRHSLLAVAPMHKGWLVKGIIQTEIIVTKYRKLPRKAYEVRMCEQCVPGSL